MRSMCLESAIETGAVRGITPENSPIRVIGRY